MPASGGGKKSIFEGLTDDEEADADSSGGAALKTDFFVPRRSVKKLQLKAISLETTSDASTAADDSTRPTETDQPASTASAGDGEDDESTPVETRMDMRKRADLDDSVTVLNIRRPHAALLNSSLALERNSSLLDETGIGESDRTVMEEIIEMPPLAENLPIHPAGIVLHRIGYYTIPSMEELAIKGLDDSGKCVVDSFTVGRLNYGHVFFSGPLDVANLNLDEIVLFRHKEVTVYADDSKKPAQGQGLNRRAEVTLDRVWPTDKTSGEYITEPQRLHLLRYEDRLARAAYRLKAKFVEYRPETGSWVFKVNHFSKYGLEDSDEEDQDQVPLPAKAATLPLGQAAQINTAQPAG